MAKSSKKSPARSKSAAGSSAASESLLTAAERKLLDGTLGRQLARASQKQLQTIVTRARGLRDKWQDLFNRQMKAAKRTSRRGETVNSRSLDKAELFAAAVRRVEARLGELLTGTTAAPPAKAARGKSTTKRAKKATASAGGRPAKKAATKPARKTAKKAATVRAGGRAEQAAAGETAVPRRTGRATTAKATSKKARQAGARKTAAAATGVVGYDRKKQRSAKASATAARIKLDGLSTRRRGHTLVAGKRKQARRDGR